MSALDYLSARITWKIAGEARLNRTGQDAQKGLIGFSGPSLTIGTAAAPAAVGGADIMLANIYTIAAAGTPPIGTQSIDLTSFTDAMGRASQSMARVKEWLFWLLGASDTVGGITGNACSGVTIGPHATNGHTLNLAGTTPTFALDNGEYQLFGSRKAAGRTVDGTHKVVYVVNGDAVLTAKLLVVAIGGTV